MPQLRYAITLFGRKMTGHRWDSVPKGKASQLRPLETPSDAFSYTNSRGSFVGLNCISDLRPPMLIMASVERPLDRYNGFGP
jgi:hypothetical protein